MEMEVNHHYTHGGWSAEVKGKDKCGGGVGCVEIVPQVALHITFGANTIPNHY